MSLEIQKLYFSYPSSHITLFENFSLQFNDGWTCIAGSNGCGKSTLLKLIAGLLKPDEGRIVSGGQSTTGCVIYCPQETAEVPENLYSVFWSDDNEVRRFFSMLHVTEEMIGRYDSLSGGEKKRIQIACALADRPTVLLLDEPTNHLDEGTVRMISDTLALFSGIGIIVSHDRSFADSLCKHTVYLYNEDRAFYGGRDCIVCESYFGGLSKALKLREQKASHNRGEWERLDSKAAGEKQRSRRLAEENERSKSRLAKKNIDPRDHDAKRKIDVARLGGKDRSTGDAKAHLENQIQRTEAVRDSVKKSLMRKEGFSVEGAGFAKAMVIEESVIFASEEKTSYKLHIPRIVINPDSKIALTGQNGTGKSLFIKHLISLAVEKPLSLLILDEPTNHMDITSVLALESALSSLSCALIVVSHDRAFLEKVTDVKLHTERIENEGRIFYDL